jgi:uncharacterized membrane protein YGL010W
MTSQDMPQQPYRFFERQMAMYATYHRDWRNRLTHFFGVPMIIFALLIAMAMWRWPFGSIEISFAMLFSFAVFLLWLAMDIGIALPLIVLLLPVLVLAEWIAVTATPALAWGAFAVFFVGGWAIQLWGHAYEGRKPALVDNLFQIFVAPMFLTAEVLIALRLRKGLHERVEAYIAERYPDYALAQPSAQGAAAE